jgi:type I restriction enzyme, S subunit
MELKEGYKQTEVGVIPNDWELISFGEAFKFLTTASYSRAQLSDNEEINYVHYGDIHMKWNHFLDFKINTLPTISNKQLKNYHLIKEGDIVMADVSEDYDGICKSVEIKNIGLNKAISGLHTFLLRDINKIFVNGFKGYIHSIKLVKDQFNRLATGLKVYGVSKNNLRVVQIPLPPTKAEQTAISTALSDIDDLIQSLTALIAKKRNIKQGAMQELLKPKDGWEVKKLGEMGEIITGSTPPTQLKGYWNGNIPWITPTDISLEKDIFCSEREITPLGLKAIRKLPANTFLVTCIASIGKNAILRRTGSCNQQINAIVPNSDNDVEFLYYLIENSNQYLLSKAGITATNIISKNDFSKISFSIPLLEEQTRIATILSDMDTEITLLETKLKKYKQIKQGMMQELLTGKTRLI